jgi:alginate O-acetyltransferase complex protein AlgI
MLFNSLIFLIEFLPAAIVICLIVDSYQNLRIWTLIVLSLFFYSYWDVRFLPVLVGSILINWTVSKIYLRRPRKALITATIIANLALLGIFKYADFFSDNISDILGVPIGHLRLALPLGLSFFTFHHIMYLVELRRGRAPIYSLDRYALYICFFPQAIAGPLARWNEVMHQFGQRLIRPGWERRMALGATFVIAGLAEKVFLADTLAYSLDPLFARAQHFALLDGSSWLALAAGFQIFFDFAGYSDIAIGLGLIFGIELPRNFDAPYRATSIRHLWQRWHMTLARFLRDYVFFPLLRPKIGGPEMRIPRELAAILITMALCGLWHGAGWNFVLWGALQGVALVAAAVWHRYGPPLPPVVGWALTVAFFLVTAILFRAGSVKAALNVARGFAVAPAFGSFWQIFAVAGFSAIVLPPSHVVCRWLNERPRIAFAGLLGLVGAVLLVQLGGEQAHEFVYFKF